MLWPWQQQQLKPSNSVQMTIFQGLQGSQRPLHHWSRFCSPRGALCSPRHSWAFQSYFGTMYGYWVLCLEQVCNTTLPRYFSVWAAACFPLWTSVSQYPFTERLWKQGKSECYEHVFTCVCSQPQHYQYCDILQQSLGLQKYGSSVKKYMQVSLQC